jgi:predicted RND superfamily exporter protein
MANNIPAQTYDALYKDILIKSIPFLMERKYCYSNPKTRNGSTESRYNLYNTVNPLIKKEYNTPKQPDDFLKDNVINVFSNNINDQVVRWIDNSSRITSLDKLSKTSDELQKYHKSTLESLNKNLNKLNNEKYAKVSSYQTNDYNMNRNKMLVKLLAYTLIVLIIILSFRAWGRSGAIPQNIVVFVNMAIFFVYLVYILLQIRLMLYERSYTNWHRLNFRSDNMGEQRE